MLLLFALSFLCKSSDFIINFTKSDYDLFLNSTGAFIRQQEGDLIVYKSTNVEDFTVRLSIDLYFDDSKDGILHIYVDPLTVNLDLDIKCLNAMKDQNSYPTIFVHDKENADNDYFNYYFITIHSDTIFYYDMTDWAIGTIESYSSTNQLMTRVSLSDMKSFYGAHSYICYNSTECLQNFDIGPYDSYFIAPDNAVLNSYINNVFVNEYTNKFYILFDKNNDFPNMNLDDSLELMPTIHLMGISKNPVQLKKDNTAVSIELILSNVRIVKKDETETSAIKFNVITIEDETQNVFTEGTRIECEFFYEYRKNDGPSRFASVTAQNEGYVITPDFENNGDILLNIKKNEIEVLTIANNLLATVPVSSSFSKISVNFINVKNINHNKIVIKNGFTDLQQTLEDILSFSFVNCEQIPIEFVDWNDAKLSNFQIEIYNNLGHIYDAIITNANSPYLKYSYENDELETPFSFPDDATSVVICLFADECSVQELTGNNIYQHAINGEDINTQLNAYLEQKSQNAQIKKLYLVLNNNLEGKELSITSDISSLTFISFIYNGEKNTLPFTLSLPAITTPIDMEIRKCSITVSSSEQVAIENLFSQNGQITGDNVNYEYEILEKNIDISSNDETITLSGQNMLKLIVKSGKSPHKIIFKYTNTNKNSNNLIYIQSDDPNYNEIPISLLVDGQSKESSDVIGIATVNLERIVLTSIPTNINFMVLNCDNSGDVQYYIPAKSKDFQQDKVSICYNNNHCSDNFDENEMYIASRTESDFAAIIKLLMQDETKIYQYIRLIGIFQNEMEYERVNFRQIPGSQTKQIWLATCRNEDLNKDGESYLILNDDMENENITSWKFEPRTFFWRKNDNKPFFFNEITATVEDDSYYLEIFDNIYENFYVESFHIPLALTSIYDYLVNCHLIEYFNKIFIDMEQELGNAVFNIECGENIVKLGGENGIELINPDPLHLYYQIPDNNDDQTIKISRKDKTIDQVNLVINKEIGSVRVNIECQDDCAASLFELNLYLMNTTMDIKVENTKCTNVNTYYIPFTINDVPNPPEIIDPEDSYTISSSSHFEFIDGGYKTKEYGKDNTVTNPSSNKILFTQNSIIISEAESSKSSEPTYFMAYHESSKIIIESNVKQSNIGVTSDRSPIVSLKKNDNPLSFKNDLANGLIEIKIDDASEKLTFKEVSHNQGEFHLSVPNSVNLVSFSDIKMSKTSSFEVEHKQQASPKQLKATNDGPTIKATKSVVVSPESTSTIKNLDLEGTLYTHANSTLKLNGNTKFSAGSSIDLSINLPIADANKNNLLINCEKALDSIPSSINISLTKNNEKVDISDLNIIGPLGTAKLCEELREKINFENENGYSVSQNCPEKEGKVYLAFSVKEKDKGSKLSGGAIAGIVIGCVAAVGIIVGLTIFFIKRKKKDLSDDNEDDSMAP